MDDIVKGRSLDAQSRRALELDTLAAILPMDRRDRLAQLLTDGGSAGAKIRRAPPVEPGAARDRSPTRDARRRSPKRCARMRHAP